MTSTEYEYTILVQFKPTKDHKSKKKKCLCSVYTRVLCTGWAHSAFIPPSVSQMGNRVGPTVSLHTASTMDRCQAEAATDDQGMPTGACVESRERIAQCLNSRWCERGALAYIQVCEPFLFIPGFDSGPNSALVFYSTLSQ